jgi:hypothetical protein
MGTASFGLGAHKYVVDDAVIPELPLCRISRRGEGIRGDVQERAAATVCDAQGSNGDCLKSTGTRAGESANIQRFWSRRKRAFSSGLLLTAPIPATEC